MIKKITNISDQGIICDFGEEVNKDINKKVINLFNYLKEKSNKNEIKGIYNIIPSYNKLVVHFDLEKNNSHKIKEIISTIDLKKLNTTQSGKSVAIAEKFCIVYPYLSPGGWNIIGRTSVKLFDTKNLTNPCLFSPGDTIKFKKVNKSELK